MRPPIYQADTITALIESAHVTGPTRRALQARLATAAQEPARHLEPAAFITLQAICERLIPQPERNPPIAVAQGIDARLRSGQGKGWRWAATPPQDEAWRQGLQAVDASAQALFAEPFHLLNGGQQDAVLRAIQDGSAPAQAWLSLSPGLFFEELLATATEIYYAHPLAQEEIGYAGMADAAGWHAIGLDQLDAHEPRPRADDA
ncbi:MAG: gluconate 2-dehydrogenase subunit 3 family protein [Chitinophagaceae bacterium]|nr:gluconate 2-dehydrogenase subunit 3 family protein [Rubrivivax sp.]